MCIVQTHTHHSAKIKTKPVGNNGVVQVDYFGALAEGPAYKLIQKAGEECERARVHIARVDRAVIACDVKAVAREGFKGSTAPGAMVCRLDQYEDVSAMCSALSAAGALRLVFLDYSEALEWAEQLAVGLKRDELLSMRRCTPLSEERDRLLVVCRTEMPANQQMQSEKAAR
jgi:hypothetical protein